MGWYERMGQWSEHHRFPVDLVGTLLLAVVVVPTSMSFYDVIYGTASTTTVLWAALILVPLPWRRVRPVASAVAIYAVALAHLLTGVLVVFPADFVLFLALFSVTVYGPRWAHRTAIASSLVGSVVLGIALGFSAGSATDVAATVFASSLFGGVSFLAVWAFGLVRRSRRETLNALRDRAERLETERDQQAQIATAAERSRIAREMHDIVAHSLSVIIAQADGGRYAATADPGAATRALTTVSETGRAALADMRRLLGVLRSDDRDLTAGQSALNTVPGLSADRRSPSLPGSAGPLPAGPAAGSSAATSGRPDLAPQPDSADLESLVAQVRASGLRISLVRMGTPRPLPPGSGLTVYRVCQEALTNVLKHAGPDPTVTVVITWGTETLQLAVDDDGRGASADGTASPGFGLLGMRERAAIFGGTVTAGPRPGGGFRVRFTMPIPRLVDSATPSGRSPDGPSGTMDPTTLDGHLPVAPAAPRHQDR